MSLTITAIALLLAGAPDQISSQKTDDPQVGSRLGSAVRKTPNADNGKTNEVMYRFLECAAERRSTAVRRMIDTRDAAEYERSSRALGDIQRCNVDAFVSNTTAVVQLGADDGTTRGMLGEIFLKKNRQLWAGLTPQPLEKTYPRDYYGLTGRAAQVDEMATCVAATDPAGITALIGTKFSSPEQRAAIGALGPALGNCLQSGYKLNTNALGLRAALAEALYHRAFDPAPVAEPAK